MPLPAIRLLVSALLFCGVASCSLDQRASRAPGAGLATAERASTGAEAYPALMESVTSLPLHTVYRPADVSSVRGRLPIVAWGNGGCVGFGNAYRDLLLEIASHGYLVIASGATGDLELLRRAQTVPGGAPPSPEILAQIPRTESRQLIDAVDWAIAEDARRESPLYHRLATDRIALMGTSCGGLQALQESADPRISTSVIMNSGILGDGQTLPGLSLTKDALGRIHSPVAYLLGGPTDIAYRNGMDDAQRIHAVPVFVGNLDVGHNGTLFEPAGGRFGEITVAWLDWQLKGDANASRRFIGAQCGYCMDTDWDVRRYNMD